MGRLKLQTPQVLRVGTRGSALAIVQAKQFARLLRKAARCRVELIAITTTGDRDRKQPLQSFGGTGVFVKELESALLCKQIDVAVHSLKDMPTRQPRGLALAAVIGREDPRDVAITRDGKKLADLPSRSIIGSGSQRRRAQLALLYPHLRFAEIRGNVETRLGKVAAGEYAGTVLARAGLKRLGVLALATETLPLEHMLPAPGQGAIGIECRARDKAVLKILRAINRPEVATCVQAERLLLAKLGGGCNLPLGALGVITAKPRHSLRLRAVLANPDGSECYRSDVSVLPGSSNAAARAARQAHAQLLRAGAAQLLAKLTVPTYGAEQQT